jgi:paraquat-inducible protein A
MAVAGPAARADFRWAEELRIWSLTDVVAIAGLIAYYRAGVPADVDLMIGAWCYLAVAVLALVVDRALDRRAIWSAILPDSEARPSDAVTACAFCELTISEEGWEGRPCPRCGSQLDPHLAWRFAPAAAVVGAAALLYFPALSFAMIVNEQLTGIVEHTVIGTVQLLADYGYWQIGVVLLLAGFVVPVAGIIGLMWMLARVLMPSAQGLVRRTRVDRAVRALVRWPMVIPFIAAIAAPIVDFPNVDDILAGPGATPYFAVVVLLMLAVRIFRPRMMWRAAGEA